MAADPFRIRDHVADFDAIVDDIRARSLATRRTVAMEANIAYGDRPGETLDIFLPNSAGSDMPIHMFIHGGYWRMFSKEDYSCVAETITGAGAVAAIVDYSLMPTARMDALVGQVLKAKAFLLAHADRFWRHVKAVFRQRPLRRCTSCNLSLSSLSAFGGRRCFPAWRAIRSGTPADVFPAGRDRPERRGGATVYAHAS